MSTSEHYDVIIIGSGAGGGTLAYKLASTGKRILVLERGGYLKRERENWDSKAIYLDGRYHAHEEWIAEGGGPCRRGAPSFAGGNTKAYGAVLFRLRDTDFGEVIHHDGASPAWPISYDELEPYYAQAERLYLVHGKAGEDHTEAWRSGDFPHPPVSHEPRIQQLSDDMERMGLHPFHLPIGIDLDESDPERSRCIRCDRFDGFPCILDAKADAHICAVRPALQHDNVSLLTHAKVERLETDPTGHTVTDVVVERHGVEQRFSADIVVVSCGAVNSAALLLKSASDAHPDGLANSSGVVGRHYMCHLNSAVIAVSKSPNDTVFEKTLGCNDFYYGADDFDRPLGHIQMLAKSDRQILKGGAPPLTPGFTLDYVAKHAIDMWLTSEDLPLEQNRVTVDGAGRIHLSYPDSNREPQQRSCSNGRPRSCRRAGRHGRDDDLLDDRAEAAAAAAVHRAGRRRRQGARHPFLPVRQRQERVQQRRPLELRHWLGSGARAARTQAVARRGHGHTPRCAVGQRAGHAPSARGRSARDDVGARGSRDRRLPPPCVRHGDGDHLRAAQRPSLIATWVYPT